MFDIKDVKSVSGKITLVDLITKENKSTMDDHLAVITKSKEHPKPMIWNEFFSGSGGNYEFWDFSEIPTSLQFFERIRVLVINYNILPVPYLIVIEGVLSRNILNELDAAENEKCRKQIEKFKNDFWNYWKNNFNGIISDPKSTYSFQGTGIVDFYFKINNTDELLGPNQKDQDFSKKFREDSVLYKYAANIGGLISITEMFENKISIVSQGYSVLGMGGFDFSWISKFEFVTDENLFFDLHEAAPIFTRQDNLLQLLLVILWQDHRINEISIWKNKILKFSKELEKFQVRGTKLKSKEMEMFPLSEKREFLIDFTSILDESRSINGFIQKLWSRYRDKIGGGEIPITGTTLIGIENEGFLHNFYIALTNRNKIVEEEYEILDDQYEILSAHLNDLLILVNTKSSVQLSESNSRTQWYILASAVVTAGASVAIFLLTLALVTLNTALVADSHYSRDLLAAIDKTNNLVLANLYSNYDLELKYDVNSFNRPDKIGGFQYDLSITNYGDYDAQVNSTWYLNEELCGKNGTHFYLNRTKLISNAIEKSDTIYKKGMAVYVMDIPKIHGNYTNLKPFTIEIVSKGTPVTPDKKPIDYFTKSKITRVQFVYDNKIKDWIPQLGWNELDCKSVPNENASILELDTKNIDHFKPL